MTMLVISSAHFPTLIILLFCSHRSEAFLVRISSKAMPLVNEALAEFATPRSSETPLLTELQSVEKEETSPDAYVSERAAGNKSGRTHFVKSNRLRFNGYGRRRRAEVVKAGFRSCYFSPVQCLKKSWINEQYLKRLLSHGGSKVKKPSD